MTLLVWLELTEFAVAVNLAVAEPAGTVTGEGTETAELLLKTVTAVATGAVALKVTLHVAEDPEFTVEGEHERETTFRGVATGLTVRLTEAALPLAPAVTVTAVVEVTVLAVSVRGAEIDPAGTTTDEGTATAPLLAESVTVLLIPTVEASETEQELVWPEVNVTGLH
jgi:hypothetical protein